MAEKLGFEPVGKLIRFLKVRTWVVMGNLRT